MDVSVDDLRAVPYLDVDRVGSRRVNLMPWWDGERWHLWTPGPNGLIDLRPVDAHLADYVGKTAASENDVVMPFVEVMWQHLSWSDVCPRISAISADFHNLGTSIEKLTLYFDNRQAVGISVTEFVKTELEYIFILSRSVFDLLQEVVSWIWGAVVQLHDPKMEKLRKQNKLPPTFSKMVLNDNQIRSAEELQAKYALSPSLASAYAEIAPFFARVRRFRDQIVHLGKDARQIFSTERGFSVLKSAYGFGDLPFWKPQHDENENLVSLLPLLAYVALGTIESCNALVGALAAGLQLPPPIAPNHRVFVRGPHNRALIWLLDIANGEAAPWWSERRSWERRRVERRAYFHWKDRRGNVWWDAESNWCQAERELGIR